MNNYLNNIINSSKTTTSNEIEQNIKNITDIYVQTNKKYIHIINNTINIHKKKILFIIISTLYNKQKSEPQVGIQNEKKIEEEIIKEYGINSINIIENNNKINISDNIIINFIEILSHYNNEFNINFFSVAVLKLIIQKLLSNYTKLYDHKIKCLVIILNTLIDCDQSINYIASLPILININERNISEQFLEMFSIYMNIWIVIIIKMYKKLDINIIYEKAIKLGLNNYLFLNDKGICCLLEMCEYIIEDNDNINLLLEYENFYKFIYFCFYKYGYSQDLMNNYKKKYFLKILSLLTTCLLNISKVSENKLNAFISFKLKLFLLKKEKNEIEEESDILYYIDYFPKIISTVKRIKYEYKIENKTENIYDIINFISNIFNQIFYNFCSDIKNKYCEVNKHIYFILKNIFFMILKLCEYSSYHANRISYEIGFEKIICFFFIEINNYTYINILETKYEKYKLFTKFINSIIIEGLKNNTKKNFDNKNNIEGIEYIDIDDKKEINLSKTTEIDINFFDLNQKKFYEYNLFMLMSINFFEQSKEEKILILYYIFYFLKEYKKNDDINIYKNLLCILTLLEVCGITLYTVKLYDNIMSFIKEIDLGSINTKYTELIEKILKFKKKSDLQGNINYISTKNDDDFDILIYEK